MKVQVIVPAAGSGTRLKASRPKPLLMLGGKPILMYSLGIFERLSFVDSVIVVARKDQVRDFEKTIAKFRLRKVKSVVVGGKTRADSVACGLRQLDPDTDVVIVHDAARPFVTMKMMQDGLAFMTKEKAVIVAVPVKPTIKKVDPKNFCVQETLARDTLWEVQTPQFFKKSVLIKAHQKMLCCAPTDDAVLVEKMGAKVKVVMGDYRNIKITTKEDLILAEGFVGKR